MTRREYLKEYRQKNKSKLNDYHKKYCHSKKKKEYYKNYRLKNIEKIKEYERKYYQAKKNKTKEKLEDIKKDVEKLKEKIHLLDGYEECNVNILIIITR